MTWIDWTCHRHHRQARPGRLTPIEYETIMSPASRAGGLTQPVTKNRADPTLIGCSKRDKEKMMENKDQAKGKIKQAVGDLTGWDALKRHGKADEKAGNVKAMARGSADYRRAGHDGTGVTRRAGRHAKLEIVKRMVSSINSQYDFRFTLPDGEEVSSRCVDPDGRRTDIHLHDDVAVSAFLAMNHRRLYEAFTG